MFVYLGKSVSKTIARFFILRISVASLSMGSKSVLPTKDQALKGREEKMVVAAKHAATGKPTVEPFPVGTEMIMFGMGCFWGAERRFWTISGVFSTQVGYAGGFTPNPTYKEACTGLTGHTEVVRVIYTPKEVGLEKLLKVFWESHDPTQDLSIMPLPPSSKGFALSGVTRKAANHGSDSNIASQSYAPNTVSFVTPISYPATLTVEVALGHT
ncbi:mitochondrial peptide methionine sulfoxide reductase [Tachysurus ichikawai]